MTGRTQPNFQESMETSDALINKLDSGSISREQAQADIARLLSSLASARGFFVSTLVGDWDFEKHAGIIIDTIRSHPGCANNLLVKNLIMSSATAVVHKRNSDEKLLSGAERVIRRSSFIVRELGTETIGSELNGMKEAIEKLLANLAPEPGAETESGAERALGSVAKAQTSGAPAADDAVSASTEFLAKQKYDREQLSAALANLNAASAKGAISSQPSQP